MNVRLRPATADDARSIAEVQVAAWRTTYRDIIDAGYLASMDAEERAARWERWFGAADIERRSLLVAVEAERGVIGFAAAGPERSCDDECAGELYAIYLLAERQRYGIGARLFGASAAALHAVGMRTMLVWVLRDNPGRGFYHRMNGTETREQSTTIGGREYAEIGFSWRLPLADAAAA
ncbi:MAG TPA: GNAT family N-acetyltransferase [Candidatus Kapabacteria bacterium]|nr:GNAT family N-acetyltransferase [Candidatus Kapabacteria bacterium]